MYSGRLSRKHGFTIIEGMLVALLLSMAGYFLSKSVVKNTAFSRFEKSKGKLDTHEARLRNIFANNQLCTEALTPLFTGENKVEDFEQAGGITLLEDQMIKEVTARGEVDLLGLGVASNIDEYGDQDIWAVSNINFDFQKTEECAALSGQQRIYFSTLKYTVSTNKDLNQKQGIQNRTFTKEITFKAGVNVDPSGVETFVNCGVNTPGVCGNPPVADFTVEADGVVATLPGEFFDFKDGVGRSGSKNPAVYENYGDIKVVTFNDFDNTDEKKVKFTDSSTSNPDHWEWVIRKVDVDNSIGEADVYGSTATYTDCEDNSAVCKNPDTISLASEAGHAEVSSLNQNLSDGVLLEPGLHEVSLFVSNSSGGDWVTRRILVAAPPKAEFAVEGAFANSKYPADHEWNRSSSSVAVDGSENQLSDSSPVVIAAGETLKFVDKSKGMISEFKTSEDYKTSPADDGWKWKIESHGGRDNSSAALSGEKNDDSYTLDGEDGFTTTTLPGGVYKVSLSVSNDYGIDTKVATRSIVVGEPPIAFFVKTDPADDAVNKHQFGIEDNHVGNFSATYKSQHGAPASYDSGVASSDLSAGSKKGSLVFRNSALGLSDSDFNRSWRWQIVKGPASSISASPSQDRGPATAEDSNESKINLSVLSNEDDRNDGVSLRLTVNDVFGSSIFEQALGSSGGCPPDRQCECACRTSASQSCVEFDKLCGTPPPGGKCLEDGGGGGHPNPNSGQEYKFAIQTTCSALAKSGRNMTFFGFPHAANSTSEQIAVDNFIKGDQMYGWTNQSKESYVRFNADAVDKKYRLHAVHVSGVSRSPYQNNENFNVHVGGVKFGSVTDAENSDHNNGFCEKNRSCIQYSVVGEATIPTSGLLDTDGEDSVKVKISDIGRVHATRGGASGGLCGFCLEECPDGVCAPLPAGWKENRVYQYKSATEIEEIGPDPSP